MSWVARLGWKPNKTDLITSDCYLIWSVTEVLAIARGNADTQPHVSARGRKISGSVPLQGFTNPVQMQDGNPVMNQ